MEFKCFCKWYKSYWKLLQELFNETSIKKIAAQIHNYIYIIAECWGFVYRSLAEFGLAQPMIDTYVYSFPLSYEPK